MTGSEPVKQFYSCNWCDEQAPHKHTDCVESPTGRHEDNRWVCKDTATASFGLTGRQGVEDHSPVPRHPKPTEF